MALAERITNLMTNCDKGAVHHASISSDFIALYKYYNYHYYYYYYFILGKNNHEGV